MTPAMLPKLAVLAPTIGTLSETFILRHMNNLHPGATVVVADVEEGPGLDERCPTLVLGRREAPRRRFAVRRRPDPEAARALRVSDFLRKHDVTVAMGEYLTWSHPWLPVVRRAGVRFFAHAHGYDVSRKLRDPQWRVRYAEYNEADGLITVSEVSRRRLLELGITPERVHVVPCGVEVPAAPVVRPERRSVRCLAVGRMIAKKGPCLTLQAFRLAAAQFDDLTLDFIGGGPLLGAAEQYVRDVGIGDRVRLLGPQPHHVVRRAMREADIFVQHSRTDPHTGDEEGLPVSILEAMAEAMPVVSTRHAGIPEAVDHGLTGLLVDEGDVDAMAECLVALSADAEDRRRLGTAGWRRVRDHFSWDHERRLLAHLLGLEAAAPARTASAPSPARSTTNGPLVTVVVPAYNRAHTIERCLESVRAQTYSHWEAVVVDDGSTDATSELTLAVARQDSRIRLVRHAQRRGAQAARNSGIKEGRGEWISFLDSDDEFLPHSLESRVHRASEAGCDVVHSACRVRHPDGTIAAYHVPRLAGHVYTQLLMHEGPVFPGLLVRRTALHRIGLLDEKIIAFQEWDTSIRLSRTCEFAFEPQPTFIYDRHGADAMSNDLLRNGRAYEQVLRKHFLPMLRHGGPRGIAQHYRRAERWYDLAGAADLARRCRRLARLWCCFDPVLVWEKLRAPRVRPT
jgi:colanic acid/amylovoran biosynthesis glycosyltransferase